MKNILLLTAIFFSFSSYSLDAPKEYSLNIGDIGVADYGTDNIFSYQEYMKDLRSINLKEHDLRIEVREKFEEYDDGSQQWDTIINIILDGEVVATDIEYGHGSILYYYENYAKKLNERIQIAKSNGKNVLIPVRENIEWHSFNPPAPVLFPPSKEEINEYNKQENKKLEDKNHILKVKNDTLVREVNHLESKLEKSEYESECLRKEKAMLSNQVLELEKKIKELQERI